MCFNFMYPLVLNLVRRLTTAQKLHWNQTGTDTASRQGPVSFQEKNESKFTVRQIPKAEENKPSPDEFGSEAMMQPLPMLPG
jgi:hypothetical protein